MTSGVIATGIQWEWTRITALRSAVVILSVHWLGWGAWKAQIQGKVGWAAEEA